MKNATSLILVARPDLAPLKEAARSSHELNLLGIKKQVLVINGVLQQADDNDKVSKLLSEKANFGFTEHSGGVERLSGI